MLRRGIFGGITKAPVRSPAFRRRSVETRPNPVAIFTESLLPPQFPSPNKTGPAFHRNPRSPGFRHVPRNCPIQSACHFQQGKPAALAPETFHHPAAVFESPDRSPPRFPAEKRGNLSQSYRNVHRKSFDGAFCRRKSQPGQNRTGISPQSRGLGYRLGRVTPSPPWPGRPAWPRTRPIGG